MPSSENRVIPESSMDIYMARGQFASNDVFASRSRLAVLLLQIREAERCALDLSFVDILRRQTKSNVLR